MEEKIPAISVIIPMYNAEKYIKQCLDSVMSQTFDNYEVIVADDCSTDRSVEIVERIIEKHRGGGKKIRLLRLPENSGGAALPRNQAMKLSRGKYITFVDADDLIAGHALTVMINAAKQFDADVVHSERFFMPTGTGDQINAQTKMLIRSFQPGPFVVKPTLETDDLAKRITRFCRRGYMWWACNKLFRRDFLIENQIEFTNVRTTEDMLFTLNSICCAERYVLIPNVLYVYRQHPTSVTHFNLTPETRIRRIVPTIFRGINYLDEFFGKIKFFREHPELKLTAINFFIDFHITAELEIYLRYPPHLIESLLRREFAKEIGDGDEIVLSHLFGLLNIMRVQLMQSQQIIANLQQQVQQTQAPSPQNSSQHNLLQIC